MKGHRNPQSHTGAALAAITLLPLLACAAFSQPASVDYARQVQPLLASRCLACHGPSTQKSGLRLDIKRRAFEGGDTAPGIVPGKSAESEIIRRITSTDPKKQMPPGKALSAAEIDLLKSWIDQGAAWPEKPGGEIAQSRHWSFQPIQHPAVPKVKNAAWVQNPIDAFILAKLEAKGLKPSPPADRVTLLRRVSLDLTGLPPSPEEVDRFLADKAPGAYERQVDRLLASPHYGERWGRHWLDLARYADSNGYTVDSARTIWPYRDWVINALNRDMPFDEFTIEQLAADLLPNATLEQKVATGFHRNTLINEEGGTDREQFRVEAVVDRANTTGSVWLGLTVGCAQCHTHKYDPILQKEYYQFFAFFNNQDEPTLSLSTPEQEKLQKQVERDLSAAKKALAAYSPDKKDDSERQKLAARVAELTEKNREVTRTRATTLVLQELPKPRQSYVHLRGDFLRHGAPVHPNVPAFLPPLPAELKSPNRLDLAHWLVDPKNPLTARVTVNRIWQKYFGTGIVETENDFGTQGSLPAHPELLDWLANSLREGSGRPWSLKAFHRLIVTSATYRQSSRVRPELHAVDPQNRLLGRQNRLRLEAEVVRDVALTASGLLCPKIGGPSVFPPQPGGLDAFTQSKKNWKASEGEDRYRRGMYTFLWRSSPYAMFTAFDAPNAQTTCTRRARSNTPLQALMLANDQAFVEMAQALAARTMRESSSDEDRLRRAFRLCLSREPSTAESKRLLDYYHSQLRAFEAEPKQAEAVAPKEHSQVASVAQAAAWTSVARVLINLDEFITRE